jgi:5-methylcytosine-specific restriction protein A
MVREAGLDVSDWEISKGNAVSAAANPKYCYNWSFVESQKLVVLNLWHSDIEEWNGNLAIKWNARDIAKSGKGVTKYRASSMDKAIHFAKLNDLPVRVVLCDGRRRNRRDQTSPPSKVSVRHLDPEPWHISSYNEATGASIVMRGIHKGKDKYIDQFDLPTFNSKAVTKKLVTTSLFVRRPEIRRFALKRAKGKCEYCGEPGFKMENGKIYLETHHIKPLSEKGSDTIDNVAALCPNHHREAHHGKIRSKISKKLLRLVGK